MSLQRAIVTGANGLIGRGIVQRLMQDGVSTLAVDCAPRAYDCDFHQCDLTNAGVLDSLVTPETTVFHLAAKTSIFGSVKDPRDDFRVNVAGTIEVLESARKAGARIVFASSSAVFDPDSPLPHRENAPKRASSPYGAGKLACENYCDVFHRCYGSDVRIVRLFNVYGPGLHRFAIYDFFHKIQNAADSIQIIGDGNQVRDFLFLDDAVDGFITVASSGAQGQDYNLGSGVPVRILDVASQMAAMMGKPHLKILTEPQSFPGDVPAWFADTRKIQGIGFKPRIDFETGLRVTLEWLSETRSRLS